MRGALTAHCGSTLSLMMAIFDAPSYKRQAAREYMCLQNSRPLMLRRTARIG